jgi:protein-S-isoprenylcysteine O-methyltransferase Ste14
MRLLTRSRLHDLFLVLAALLAASATRSSLVLGAGVWTVGVALQVWSKAALKRYDVLSTTGPYALCRHPFYLANAIFDLGICVMSGNPWLVALYPFAFGAGYGPTIRQEEAELSALHPDAWAEFRRTTPTVLPTLRRWRDLLRAPLSWENLRVERQLSRTVRYGAFPLVVWVAARAWARPAEALCDGNMAIFAAAAGLGLVGLVLYSVYERRADSLASRLAVRLAPHAALWTTVVLFAAVALREIELEDFALAATIGALLAGWSLAAASLGARVRTPARLRRGVVLAGLAALSAYGAWALEMTWVIPVVLAAALAWRLAPEPKVAMPKLRLTAGVVFLAAGLGAMGVFRSMWVELRTLSPIRAALREETRDDDLVVILEDRELRVLVGAPGIDGEVSGDDVGRLAHQREAHPRIFLLAEDDDMHRIPPRVRERLHVRREFRVWFETFYLFELRPERRVTDPATLARVRTFPCAPAETAHN